MNRLTFSFILLLAVSLVACKKPNDSPAPNNPDPQPATSFEWQLKVASLPGLTEPLADLEFIITLHNSQGDPYLADKKLPIIDSGGYYSARLTLPNAGYQLEKVLLAKKTGAVKFATPISGSVRAQQISKPLAIAFSNNQQALKIQEVELLPVQTGDHESLFGYSEGIFNLPPDGNNPPPMTKKIFVHPIVKVGSIVYDSIPVMMQLFSYDAQNNASLNQFSVSGGLQQISLPANGVRFRLKMQKWGGQSEMEITMAEASETNIYKLETTLQPRRLKDVISLKLVNNFWQPLTKATYQYDAQGNLQQILHYRKHADNSTYLAMTDEARYDNNRVSAIVRKAANGRILATTSFQYNANGLVNHVRLQQGDDSLTQINLQYLSSLDRYNQVRIDQVGAQYTYNFSSLTHTYQAGFNAGNRLTTTYASSHGDLEEGLYDYDLTINPFILTGWPDLNHPLISKNNLKSQSKNYVNAYPENEIYSFSYTYNGEGYPTELRTAHRDPITHQHEFDLREVFVYY